MRGPLSRIKARVDRLAGEVVREGCPACRKAETTPRYMVEIEHPEAVDFGPKSETRSVCGRTYPLTHVLIVLEQS